MRLPSFLTQRLRQWAVRTIHKREPDFVIGEPRRPYLKRWWVIPRNRFFNIYLHLILRSDDDRALHDHPWVNCSILLQSFYIEHTIEAGGIKRQFVRYAGSIVFRGPSAAHRLEVPSGAHHTPAISLFITGPRIREWGFHCPDKGWRNWKIFTAPADRGQIGRGCE